MTREVSAAVVRWIHAVLTALQVFGLPCEALSPSSSHLILYNSWKSWPEARAVCHKNGWELARIDPFNTEFLREQKRRDSTKFLGNIWIGLYDVAQEYNSLGSKGFRWAGPCHSIGQQAEWYNWMTEEPRDRSNNFCVRLERSNQFTWFPEQCSSSTTFLCEERLGTPCTTFKGFDGCNTTQLTSMTIVSEKSTSESGCKQACLDYVDSEPNITCWGGYFKDTECMLYVGTRPFSCTGSTAVTTAVWIRDCYSIKYDTETASVPNSGTVGDACNSSLSTTGLPETTSPSTTESTTTQPTTATATSAATTTTTATTQKPTTLTITTETMSTLTTTSATTTTTATEAVTTPATTEATTTATEAVTTPATTEATTTAADPTTTSALLTRLATTAAVTGASTVATSLSVPPQTTATAPDQAGSLQTTTTVPDVTTAVNLTTAALCSCKCHTPPNPAIVDVTKTQEVAQQIKKELTIDKSTLSSTRRRKTSAPDERPSAKATGAFGVILVVGAFCLIVVPDVRAIYQAIRFGPYR